MNFGVIPETQTEEQKEDMWDNTRNFFTAKAKINSVSRECLGWEKIFALYSFEKKKVYMQNI